jgi:hypothetical protein
MLNQWVGLRHKIQRIVLLDFAIAHFNTYAGSDTQMFSVNSDLAPLSGARSTPDNGAGFSVTKRH